MEIKEIIEHVGINPYFYDNDVVIYHARCYNILRNMPPVDLVLTDPPYLTSNIGGGLAKKRDYLPGLVGLTESFDMNVLRPFANWMCFCSKDQLVDLINLAKENGRWMLLSWNKPDPTPLMNNNYLPDTEYIVHRFTKLYGEYHCRSRFTVLRGGDKTLHPTCKPIELIYKLIQSGSEIGHVILDPFAGSGTTGRAAKDLKRKAILIEIEEKYCETAANRMLQGVLL